MVKGVHKSIVEISNTGNDYFDRAILFVRPAGMDLGGERLDRKGQEYLCGLRVKPGLLRRRLFSNVFKVGSGFLAGAGATFLLLSLL